jgi:hypothetical protein
MRRILGVSFVLLTTFGLAAGADAQQDPTRQCGQQASEFSLEQNFPNPFSAQTQTRIPFTLCESLFAEGRSVVVSMRVVNVIQQFVAPPTAISHPAGEGVPAVQLEYFQPGRYFAAWDARDQNGMPVVPGVYWVQLTVNGLPTATRRMFVSR